MDIETRHLEGFLSTLDELYEKELLTTADYIQIGLLVKILESMENLRESVKTNGQ